MEEKYAEYYTEILQDWLQRKILRSKIILKQGENIPIPLEYFIYITIIKHKTNLRYLVLELDNGYTVNLTLLETHLVLINAYKGKGYGQVVTVEPSSLKFKGYTTLSQIEKVINNLEITILETNIIIDNATIKSFFLSASVEIDIKHINEKFENIYKLYAKHNNYKELKLSLQAGKGDTAYITVTLISINEVTSREGSKQIMNRESNYYKIKKFFSEYLRFDNLIGRVKDIESDYLFERNGYLEVKLFLTLTFYTDEEYYAPRGYGYYESAIENICRQGVSSSLAKIEEIAEELGVDMDNLKDDEVCEALWQAFYDLVDEP